jgi:hypothetical protein
MKANELRIGNLVNHKTGQCKVVGFYGEIFRAENINKIELKSNVFNLQPIPLTEEWLLKLGLFKITKKEDLWGNDEIGVYDFKGKIRWSDFFITSNGLKDFTLYVATIDDGMESAECLNNIIYVHQLQNLYFALTGEELTIKEW